MGIGSKNIIIVLPFLSLGGAETQAFYVALGLKQKGHNVTVVAFDKKSGKLISKLEDHGIPWELADYDLSLIHQSGWKKFTELIKFGLFLRKLKPDFLLPFTYYPNVLCSCVRILTGAKKCFWNQRGMEALGVSIIEKIAIRSKPSYLSNSIGGAEFIAKRHNIEVNSIGVISNGIEESKIKNDSSFWERRIKLQKDELVFVMVANFFPEKNHPFLLSSWQKFNEQFPNEKLKLVLVGYSPNNWGLFESKSIAFDHQMDNVVFLESSDDIPGLLKQCDIGLLTSSSEGCPNSVLEYMLSGKPAIVSEIKATTEIFGNDYPLFCDLNDENSLVDSLAKTLDPEFRAKIAEENRQLVKEKYSIDNLKLAYQKLIEL
jgi:glycosyltransferase involved in cell wall biosynthesis